jgi:hypothetical protein
MPTGLNLEVSADVQQAVKAMDTLAKEARETGAAVSNSLNKGLAPSATSLNKVTAAAAALNAQLPKTSVAFKNVTPNVRSANSALIGLTRVVQDAPFGFIAIQNNLTELPNLFRAVKAETGSTATAFKALGASLLGAGGIGFAISAITSAITFFSMHSRGATQEVDHIAEGMKAAAEREKEFAAAIDQASESLLGQAKNLADLRTILISTTGSLEDIAQATVNQGVAAFLFDQKNTEVQKGLNELIKEQLRLRKNVRPFNPLGERPEVLESRLERMKKLIQQFPKISEAPGELKRLLDQQESDFNIRQSEKQLQAINDLSTGLTGFFKEMVDGGGKADKSLDDIISRAKALQSEFPSLFPPLYLSELDSLQEQAAKAGAAVKIFFDNLSKGFPRAATGISAGVAVQIIPDPPPVTVLRPVAQETVDKLTALFKAQPIPVAVDFAGAARSDEIARIFGLGGESILTKTQKEAVFAAQAIQGILTPAFQDLFNTIITNENPMKAFFQSLGRSVQQLIQKLIAAAIQAAVLSAIFPGGVGGAKGFGQIFGKILGFAAGGVVTGPTLALIGEGAGTSRSNPEVVAPLDRLRAMIGDIGGQAAQPVIVMQTLRGDTIRYQQARTERRQRRSFGR